MSTPFPYLLASSASLAFSFLAVPLVGRVAKRVGIIDVPNTRKVHAAPVPRIGGVGIGVAFFASFLLVLLSTHFYGLGVDKLIDHSQLATLLMAGLFVLVVGLLDDLFDIPARYKLVALLVAGASLCASGVHPSALQISHNFAIPLPEWGAWPLSVVWIVGVTVSINFIDGLDGLAAGIVTMAAGVLAVSGHLGGSPEVIVLACCLAGSLAGFWVHNWHPARIFMGDSGSMFIGFMFAAISLLLTTKTRSTTMGLIVPGIALSVPLVDGFLTMVRRSVLQRRSVFSAERGHIHHNLLDQGLSQRQVVIALYSVTFIACAVAVAVLYWGGWAMAGSLAILLLSVGSLFRTAGSTRLRETFAALQRNRALGRESRRYRMAFEEMQMRFRTAATIDTWWGHLCDAAHMFDFISLTLPLTNRDGTARILHWRRDNQDFEGCETATALLPIRQRRAGPPLRAEVEVAAATFLESAGHRIALFSRLVGDHSLASIDQSPLQPAAANELPASVGPMQGARRSRSRRAPILAPGSAKLLGGLPRTSPAALDGPVNPISPAPGRGVDNPRVAIVHDFLYVYAGAEKVLEQIIDLYPDADLFALFDFLPDSQRGFIRNKPVKTSFLQNMPLARKLHRSYLPLMPLAVEQLDVSAYDIVISSSYVAAKGVITRPNQLHICYCHTPARFAWDLQTQYLDKPGLIHLPGTILARLLLHYIRQWDTHSANRVDLFLTNSAFVAARIRKTYRRDARVIYPPVDTEGFQPGDTQASYYLTASRLVPYKRIDLIVRAFAQMPERRLVVVGDGPEMARLSAIATPNVRLVGRQPHERLVSYMQMAKAFIFAAEEDFGIAPVEAQACGTPVIAYGQGGVTESVIPGRTGVFFPKQDAASIVAAVREFEALEPWDRQLIHRNAERFSVARFQTEFRQVVRAEWNANRAQLRRASLDPVTFLELPTAGSDSASLEDPAAVETAKGPAA